MSPEGGAKSNHSLFITMRRQTESMKFEIDYGILSMIMAFRFKRILGRVLGLIEYLPRGYRRQKVSVEPFLLLYSFHCYQKTYRLCGGIAICVCVFACYYFTNRCVFCRRPTAIWLQNYVRNLLGFSVDPMPNFKSYFTAVSQFQRSHANA